MSFDSFEEIVKFAIEREKEAAAFYEDASKQETYAGAKEAFEEFAGQERNHRAMLEGFLAGEKAITDYDFKWIPDLKRSNYLVDLEYEKGMPFLDILRIAMKREEKALQLYRDMEKQAEGEDLKKIFRMLRQEEAKHKLTLETIYDDAMAKMGD
jgi:rubrerythrin